MSPKEQALWLFQQLTPDAGVLNVPAAIRLPRRLQWWPAQGAVRHLVRRHPALRTLFPAVDGLPARRVLAPDDPLTAVKLESLATDSETIDADLRAFTARPFDFTADLPLRAGQFLNADGDDVLCVVVPHIVFDATSTQVLLDELTELYGALATTGEIPAHLAGVVDRYVERPPAEASIRYWREHLAGAAESGRELHLARQGERSADFAGDFVLHQLSPSGYRALADLSDEFRVTRNIVLLCAFYALLARHGAGEDVVVGMPLDARDPAARGAIGYHVNIVGMRSKVDARSTFRQLVSTNRDVFLAALQHAGASIDEVFPGSYQSGDDWRRPLFRYMFNYLPPAAGPGTGQVHVHNGYSRLDLNLVAMARPDGLVFEATYHHEAFTARDVTALVRRLDALLVGLAAAPDAPLGSVPLWSDEDRELVRSTDTSIVDEDGIALPPGLPGELCRSGARTGKRARWTFDGTVELLDAEPTEPTASTAEPEAVAEPQAQPEPVPADDAVAATLTTLWQELLDRPNLDDSANFFLNGGSSILAGRLVARVRQITGTKLSLRQVFTAPTPRALASVLAEAGAARD